MCGRGGGSCQHPPPPRWGPNCGCHQGPGAIHPLSFGCGSRGGQSFAQPRHSVSHGRIQFPECGKVTVHPQPIPLCKFVQPGGIKLVSDVRGPEKFHCTFSDAVLVVTDLNIALSPHVAGSSSHHHTDDAGRQKLGLRLMWQPMESLQYQCPAMVRVQRLPQVRLSALSYFRRLLTSSAQQQRCNTAEPSPD
jgi:hypothetical protein